MAIIRKIPWTIQPPNRVEQFSKTFLGQHCIWAVVPGWDQYFANTSVAGNSLRSVGQVMQLDLEEFANPTSGSVTKVTRNHGGGVGSTRSVLFDHESHTRGYRFRRPDADLGIIFPDLTRLTILTIVKPTGDGRPLGAGDPRIFTIDTGAAANNHDLMIGEVSSGNEVRTRIRIGSSTQTVVTTGGTIQDDAVQLIAGTVEPASATNSIVRAHHLGLDGTYTTAASSSVTGSYNPRTTTDMAIGATAGSSFNAFEGEVIGVYAFNIDLHEQHFREILDNPWQVFAPRTQIIPIDVATGATAVLTGTSEDGLTESEITTGGETIIITLTGDTWKAAGTGPIGSTADTQAIIDGLDAADSQATGWNAEVRDKEVTTAVVRTSSTIATITLTASGSYDITTNETITCTVPTAALVTGAAEITATPTIGTIADVAGRIMSSLAYRGGLAGMGGIAGEGGGLAGQ